MARTVVVGLLAVSALVGCEAVALYHSGEASDAALDSREDLARDAPPREAALDIGPDAETGPVPAFNVLAGPASTLYWGGDAGSLYVTLGVRGGWTGVTMTPADRQLLNQYDIVSLAHEPGRLAAIGRRRSDGVTRLLVLQMTSAAEVNTVQALSIAAGELNALVFTPTAGLAVVGRDQGSGLASLWIGADPAALQQYTAPAQPSPLSLLAAAVLADGSLLTVGASGTSFIFAGGGAGLIPATTHDLRDVRLLLDNNERWLALVGAGGLAGWCRLDASSSGCILKKLNCTYLSS